MSELNIEAAPSDAASDDVPATEGLRLSAWHPVDLLSLAGAVICISAGVLAATGGPLLAAGALFALGGLFDVLDGLVARRVGRANRPAGAFVDSVCDKLGEAAVVCGLVVVLEDRLAVGLLVGGYAVGSLSSYVKATAGEHGLRIDWPGVRIFGRAGRVVLLAAALIVAGLVDDPVASLTIGAAVLLAFNVAAFCWRLGRVVHAISPPSRRHRPERQARTSVLPFPAPARATARAEEARVASMATRR